VVDFCGFQTNVPKREKGGTHFPQLLNRSKGGTEATSPHFGQTPTFTLVGGGGGHQFLQTNPPKKACHAGANVSGAGMVRKSIWGGGKYLKPSPNEGPLNGPHEPPIQRLPINYTESNLKHPRNGGAGAADSNAENGPLCGCLLKKHVRRFSRKSNLGVSYRRKSPEGAI